MSKEVNQKLVGIMKKLEKARTMKGAPLEFIKLIEAVEGLADICNLNDARIGHLQERKQ